MRSSETLNDVCCWNLISDRQIVCKNPVMRRPGPACTSRGVLALAGRVRLLRGRLSRSLFAGSLMLVD